MGRAGLASIGVGISAGGWRARLHALLIVQVEPIVARSALHLGGPACLAR